MDLDFSICINGYYAATDFYLLQVGQNHNSRRNAGAKQNSQKLFLPASLWGEGIQK
jgi:hypothetical protein